MRLQHHCLPIIYARISKQIFTAFCCHPYDKSNTRCCYKQRVCKQRQTEIGKKIKQKLSNNLRLNFCYLKIIRFLQPKIIEYTLKDV